MSSDDRSSDERTFKAVPLDPLNALRVLLATVLPTVAAIVGLSLMGFGLDVFNAIARAETVGYGYGLLAFLALWLALLFVFDAQLAPSRVQSLLALITLLIAISATLLLSMIFPWATALLLLVGGAVNTLWLRTTDRFKYVKRRSFYGCVGAVNAMCVVFLVGSYVAWTFATDYTSDGARWKKSVKTKLIADTADVYEHIYKDPLVYSVHCAEKDAVGNKIVQTDTGIEKGCKRAETVWTIIWLLPFAATVIHAMIAAFCLVESHFSLAGSQEVIRLSQEFLSFLVFILIGMYASLTLAGSDASLAGGFMAFFLIAGLAMALYAITEIQPSVLVQATKESQFAKYVFAAFANDWVRALGLLALNVLIPGLLILDFLRQRIRVLKGTSPGATKFTESMQKRINIGSTWNWNGILDKVNLICELAVVLLIAAKMTFIFFSWLNGELIDVSLGIVVTLVFFIGVFMFLLPPVPGSAVYLFAGIVITAVGEKDLTFWGAAIFSSAVALAAKLFGSAGQWGIGYMLGTSVSIQKMIGVDSVPTRAVEKILKTKGFDIGKISILVGGPDWPTSVTSGILKVNIVQMLVGTLPVYIASVLPQAIVGALLNKGNEEADSGEIGYGTMKSAAAGIAAFGQAATTLMAAYFIANTVEKHHDELAEFRPEHAAVAALTAQQEELMQAYGKISAWDIMLTRRKFVISLAAFLQWLTIVILSLDFVIEEKVVFRAFAVNGNIGDDYVDGGLNGNAWNIVKMPFGPVALGLFAFATLTHLLHGFDLTREAKLESEPVQGRKRNKYALLTRT